MDHGELRFVWSVELQAWVRGSLEEVCSRVPSWAAERIESLEQDRRRLEEILAKIGDLTEDF